jgi:hypothetical protein
MPRRRPTPRRPPPWTSNRRCRIGHAERLAVETTRSTTQSVCCLALLGADVNYLVGAPLATFVMICGTVKYVVYTTSLRIS